MSHLKGIKVLCQISCHYCKKVYDPPIPVDLITLSTLLNGWDVHVLPPGWKFSDELNVRCFDCNMAKQQPELKGSRGSK